MGALLDRLTRDHAYAGIAIRRDGPEMFRQSFHPGMDAPEWPMFRVASVSKVVLGQVFLRVAQDQGWHHPFTAPAEGILGWSLRHPTGSPISLGQLLAHCGGLRDSYGVPLDANLRDWIRKQGDAIFGREPPGTFYRYSNLGYILLAACLEAATGTRFDMLARRLVLDPLGVAGGFNWSGVGASDRARAWPTYRRSGKAFLPQIDGTVAQTGVQGPDGIALDLSGYTPGDNPAAFSPQGGLRTDLPGLLTLAGSLERMPSAPLWQQGDGEAEDLDGLVQDWGAGIQINPAPNFYPRPLIGHFGVAYGFKGGVWYDKQAGLRFAYALNGRPLDEDSDALSPEELKIFAAIADVKG